MANEQLRQAVRQELNAMIRDGLVEPLPGDACRLTAAGRAYVAARHLCDPHQIEGSDGIDLRSRCGGHGGLCGRAAPDGSKIEDGD